MRLLFPMASVIFAAGFAACSENHAAFSPTAPGPVAGPGTATQIRAFIADTAFRTLSGVRVEALDGATAGQSAVTNEVGIATLSGAFDKNTHFQASKAGYETLTNVWQCSVATCPSNGAPYVLFYLRPLATPIDMGGEYTMTITADRACASPLPPAARARSYQVTVSKRFRAGTSDLIGYDAVIQNDDVLAPVRRFSINVAGNYLSIYFRRGEGELPGLIEQLAENEYVAITASATGSVSQGTTLVLGVNGTIDYVATRAPLTGAVNEPINAVSRETCSSEEGHRLMLVRN